MKIIELGKKSVAGLYLFVMSLVLIDVLICQNFINQICKKEFALSNIVLLLLGLLVTGVLSFLALRYYKYVRIRADRWICRRNVAFLAFLLFWIQLYVAKNVYFLTGWDVKVLVDSAQDILNGRQCLYWYYLCYPNNVFLTYFYALIFHINHSIGIFSTDVFAIITLQCLFSAIAAYLVYSVSYEITKSKPLSLLAFCIYVGLVGTSPWFVIPYSDGTGLLFPILIFRLYQLAQRAEREWGRSLLWVLLGAVVFVGFKIKPQIIIVFIAILLAKLAEIAFTKIRDRKKLLLSCLNLLICLAGLCSAIFAFSVFTERQTAIALDDEKAFGITHFFMMGLHDETDGVYHADDVTFSGSFATKEERVEANIRVAKERLTQMGVGGFIRHLTEKALVNFGDGTFAWAEEGTFFDVILPEPNAKISPFLRSFYYFEGTHREGYITAMQGIWLTVLTLGVCSVIYVFKRGMGNRGSVAVILLALLGLTAFEMLFEARARYLFTYAPLYIICAVVGLYAVLKYVQKMIERKGEKA